MRAQAGAGDLRPIAVSEVAERGPRGRLSEAHEMRIKASSCKLLQAFFSTGDGKREGAR